MLKKILITFSCCALLQLSPVQALAEEAGATQNTSLIDKGADWIEDWNRGEKGVHKEIARPISKEVLKRAGQPGFFISKYLNYRKLIAAPQCTTSQKLSYYANLLTLAGDVALNVLTWKQTRDLKKEFEGKLGELQSYAEENDLTKMKEKSKEKPDVQMMAFDYAIKKDEQELQRLNILQYFKYPALAMHLTSTILNAQEALAEGTSLGTAAAAANSCMTAQQPQKKAETAATDAKTEAAPTNNSNPEEPAWYMKPFLWLAEKAKAFKTSAVGQAGKKALDARREYKRGVNTGKEKDNYTYTNEGGDVVSGMGPVNSAAYAEEMIVGVISHFKKPSTYAKNRIVNKLGQDLEVMAIRYAVRTMVKANIEAVDKFMRSSVGRAVVYAYNIWVIYTEFDDLRDQIKATKEHIAKLKEIKAKLSESTAQVIPSFEENKAFVAQVTTFLMTTMLGSEAQAELAPANPYKDLKFCIGADSCGIVQNLFDKNANDHFAKLHPDVQKAQKDLLMNSYTIRQVNQVINGKMSVTDIDLAQVNKEIKRDEGLVEQYYQQLDKRGILKKDELARFESKLLNEDYKAYAPLMREDFNTQTLVASSGLLDSVFAPAPKKEKAKGEALSVGTQPAPDINSGSATTTSAEVIPVRDLQYDIIHGEDGDLWNIIHKRYMQYYEKLGAE